jgi:hypothetical protein
MKCNNRQQKAIRTGTSNACVSLLLLMLVLLSLFLVLLSV